MRHAILPFALVLAACGGAAPPPAGSGTAPRDDAATTTFRAYDPGAQPGGPGTGARYGMGRAPTAREVAAWNDDVGPDGAELPAGRGTVAEGRALYAARCMACHNRNGEGLPPLYPALIGRDAAAEGFRFASDPTLVKTIGNYWPTATTVFDYVKRAMPLTQPGSLTNPEVYALTAFLLAANQVIPQDAALDADALRKVRMPYADRFVPDDRRGGPDIR